MTKSAIKYYALTILLVILAFTFLERSALAVAVEGIKTELSLSDTQIGLLTGLAFSLFYSVAGIPLARWADRGNRITIISVTTALCGVAVAVCGAVGNFYQLILIRIGVAVGEAGCVPTAQSLIADLFTREERPRATAIYMLGAPLSGLVGYLLSGWLNEVYGWRVMFVILGFPSIALAMLALTLKDPRFAKPRAAIASDTIADLPDAGEPTARPLPRHVPLADVFGALWSIGTFRHLLYCFMLLALLSSGIMLWQPAFFIRTYGLGTGELGVWFAAITGLGGALGTLGGGEFASRFLAGDERLQLNLMGLAYASLAVTSAFIYLAPNPYWAFGFMALTTVVASLTTAPLFAILQTLVPPDMRATSVAILYLFSNLVGAGLGPLAVGVLSDALHTYFADDSLRYALLAACPGYIWAGWHMWIAGRGVADDLTRVEML